MEIIIFSFSNPLKNFFKYSHGKSAIYPRLYHKTHYLSTINTSFFHSITDSDFYISFLHSTANLSLLRSTVNPSFLHPQHRFAPLYSTARPFLFPANPKIPDSSPPHETLSHPLLQLLPSCTKITPAHNPTDVPLYSSSRESAHTPLP